MVSNIRFYIIKRFSYCQIVIFEKYLKTVKNGLVKNNSNSGYYLLCFQVF